MELGKSISTIRKQHNMTAVKLAAIIGIKQPYLSQIETGKRTPSFSIIKNIAQALDVTVSELIGEVPQQLPGNIRELVDAVKDLNKEQVDSLISVVMELGVKYGKDNS